MMELPLDLDEIVRRALAEDIGRGDVTSVLTVGGGDLCVGQVVARASGVIAGAPVFERVMVTHDPSLRLEWAVVDGTAVEPGRAIGEVRGSARSVLAAERVGLNLLQRMSGIATLTCRFVEAAGNSGARILCTRKSTPGLRGLERYAVEAGGGRLHRAGLDDGILIKRNHERLAGGVAEAVKRAKAGAPHTLKVEVEVERIDELEEALEAGADAILLDNADDGTLGEAVELIAGRVPLEVSGGVTLERIPQITEHGPVLISVGRLTHSAPAMDIALEISPV
jgi:nicotinate-nucleotide pyrophosphorylase (carboxylating)